jgi:hypothetical protein
MQMAVVAVEILPSIGGPFRHPDVEGGERMLVTGMDRDDQRPNREHRTGRARQLASQGRRDLPADPIAVICPRPLRIQAEAKMLSPWLANRRKRLSSFR